MAQINSQILYCIFFQNGTTNNQLILIDPLTGKGDTLEYKNFQTGNSRSIRRKESRDILQHQNYFTTKKLPYDFVQGLSVRVVVQEKL